VHIRPAFKWFAHTFVPGPDCGLVYPVLSSRARACRRNHQVPRVPLPDVGVTFIRDTCTPPPGTLLPVPSSYGLIRQSHVALPYFGISPRWWSPCRLLSSPCCHRDHPDVILRIVPVMPEPMPRRSTECFCLVLPQCRRPSPCGNVGRLPHLSVNAIFHGPLFEAAAISLCSSLTVCSPHRSLPPLQIFLAGRPRLLRPS
jgi:hypothetical protein